MRRHLGPILAVASLALGGCASFGGPTDEIAVNSEPPGAECRVERMGRTLAVVRQTPGTVRIDRSHYPIDILCSKEGSAGARTVMPGVNPLVYGDVLLGGVPYVFDSLFDSDRTQPDTLLVRFPVTP
jgi:hypothetical protein